MSVAVEEGRQGTTILTGCPLSFTIVDYQEIPIQNVFNFVYSYKGASHFPYDELEEKKIVIHLGRYCNQNSYNCNIKSKLNWGGEYTTQHWQDNGVRDML
jgi:hypothetical protein